MRYAGSYPDRESLNEIEAFLACPRYSRFHRHPVSRSPSFHFRSTRGNQRTMRNGAEYNDGGDGNVPLSEDRRFRDLDKGAPRWGDTAVRTGVLRYCISGGRPRSFGWFVEILSKLKTARGNFDEPWYGSLAQTPRQPSIFERELENPRLTNQPLTQPTPHAFDSAPMRPVSVAIQEGVGLFLHAPRSSVFGKFW